MSTTQENGQRQALEETTQRTLKEVCTDIKVKWYRLRFNPEDEQTEFVARIGSERFDFRTGLRACVSDADWKALKRRYSGSIHSGSQEDIIFARIEKHQVKASKNVDNKTVMAVFEAISRLSKPTAYDLIYCLKSDSDASRTTFEDWCGNCGYDTDSRKAFATYELCQQNDTKLRRAVGNDVYNAIMNAEDEQ